MLPRPRYYTYTVDASVDFTGIEICNLGLHVWAIGIFIRYQIFFLFSCV